MVRILQFLFQILHKCLGVGHFYPCSGVGFCPTVIIHANTGGVGNTRVISRQSRPKIQILPDFFTQPELTIHEEDQAFFSQEVRRQQCRAPHRCGGGPDKVITLAQRFPVARQTAVRLRHSARFLAAAIGVDNTVGRNKDITLGIFLHDGFDILQIIRVPGIISIQKADVLPRRQLNALVACSRYALVHLLHNPDLIRTHLFACLQRVVR